jgi:hypothetical protein
MRVVEQYFSIEGSEEADEELDAEYDGDFRVFYSDEIAHQHEALVAASVDFIAAFPGVTSAMQADREAVLVWGNNVDRVALATDLTEWVRTRIA